MHYAKITDHHRVTTHTMWVAYAWGIAIICANNHCVVNCINGVKGEICH